MKHAPFFGLRCLPRDSTGMRSGVLWTVGDGWDLGIIMTGSWAWFPRTRAVVRNLEVSKRPNTVASQGLGGDHLVNAVSR